MKARRFAIAMVVARLMLASPSIAEDITPQMPDAGYGSSDFTSPGVQGEVPMPNSNPGGDGSAVSVPIPGGGSVLVEGPPASAVNDTLSPTETWGEHQNMPNSMVGAAPMGP